MKKCILCLMTVIASISVFSQADYSTVLNSYVYTNGSMGYAAVNANAYNGRDFSPHGTFKILIIYAGFHTSGSLVDNQSIDYWPATDALDQHNTVPNYVAQDPFNLIFSDASQLSDPAYADVANLTRYYYEQSLGDFILIGDYFSDTESGEPIRINIDPTGANDWGDCNEKLFQKIQAEYGDQWNDIFGPFDNRDNYPNYVFDNSLYKQTPSGYVPASGDGEVDFIIIHWRYNINWTTQPVVGQKDWTGSGGGLSNIVTYSYDDYTTNKGFTVTTGGLDAFGMINLIAHEFAHDIYDCPHNMGANTPRGYFLHFPSVGWGMMGSFCRTILSANAWESWLLGWHDLNCGPTDENSDITNPSALNSSGNYVLGDFTTTGDAIRVNVPNTQTYLWIENHQGFATSEIKPWLGVNPSWAISNSNSNIADFSKGIYMFTEDLASNRLNYTMSAGTLNKVNRMLPLNPQGNYDYLRTEYPKVDPNNPNKLDTRYSWGNPTYVFEKTQNNPICGTNPWFKYFDDFHRYDKSTKLHVSSPDGVIDTYFNHNNGDLEAEFIACETDGTNEYITNSCFGGRNTTASTLGQRRDAFEPGDELSISGIIPVLNNPEYDESTCKTGIYSLNGLKISIVSENLTTHEITVHISFNDYTLTQDKRWCGLIDLPDITSNTNSDLIIHEGVTLEIDKSGTPNRHSLTTDGDFINPTVFTIKSGSKLEIEEGAEIIVKNGSTLVLESGATLLVDNGGTLTIEESANFDYQGGTINLSGNNSLIDITGNLSISANTQFTFTGAGYIKFSNPGDDWTENITCGSGASIYLHGSGQSDKVLEVQQNTVRFPAMASLTFEDCKIEMGAGKRMIPNTNFPITFDNVLLTSTSGSYNAHRSFYFYNTSNATIENSIFEYGIYGLQGHSSNLDVNSSEFRYNTYGLHLTNLGVDISSGNFHHNTSYGLYCSGMSLTSSILDCDFTLNAYGMYYQGSSSADLDVSMCDIVSNTYDGIKTSGAFDLNLTCNNINANNNGVYTQNGTLVYANNNAQNNISLNTKTIYLSYGRVFLDEGYNQLQSIGDGFTIYGGANENAKCGYSINRQADRNRWESSSSAGPDFGNNYLLYVYSCLQPTNIILTDASPSYTICYHIEPGRLRFSGMESMGENSEQSSTDLPIICFPGTNGMSLDEALDYLDMLSTNIRDESEYNTLIENYISVIELSCTLGNSATDYYFTKAYGDLHRIISDYYILASENPDISEFSMAIDDIIALNETLLMDVDKPYVLQIEYKLDIALLDRMRGNFNSAILRLESLIGEINDPHFTSEQAYAEYWLCHIEAEKQLEDGNITIDEFATAIAQCDALYAPMENGDYYNESFGAEEQANPVGINIQPNPSQGVFSVQVNGAEGDGMIRITKSGGQIVYSQVYTGQALNISGFTKGEYTVYYIENQVVKASAWLIVE